MKKLQIELVKLQDWVINHNKKIAVIFEGREAEKSKWGTKVKEPKAMELSEVNDVQVKIDEVIAHVRKRDQD